MAKTKIRHVGNGRTHPEANISMLMLKCYLEYGFDPMPPDSLSKNLGEGESKWEQKWADQCEQWQLL